jgi:hypothetical protein
VRTRTSQAIRIGEKNKYNIQTRNNKYRDCASHEPVNKIPKGERNKVITRGNTKRRTSTFEFHSGKTHLIGAYFVHRFEHRTLFIEQVPLAAQIWIRYHTHYLRSALLDIAYTYNVRLER